MKSYILLIISCSLININCTSQQKSTISENKSIIIQKNEKIEKIEIIEKTRGTNRIISFTPTSKIVSVNGNITTTELPSIEWQNILKQATTIDLSKISLLESPTTNRYSDKALSSKISIISNGKTYLSSDFDAGVPPKELENLYSILMINSKGQRKPPRNNIR
ncbi:hypothetical protein [Chryseobacterium limigenitum]|uniref:Uncharacterized protein n=1 Tax=Chryseobacterium limigenitum TaxID=1612149 RepID=A0A1K2IWE0_9FLAO|nr:hypothetical protein [Chryseobacterium limigenitum]SFZ96748.1 hypothetical protein SAMN05216324_12525 [Chryseobacterium limigenitum]